ncbi:MAG: oxepin-CoA hydrolase, alternative type [Caldimonas sp.]
MPSELLTERRGTTLVLTISDPPTRNTLSAQVVAAGIEALGASETKDDVRAVVLRGEGANFCAGGNLHSLAERRAAGRAAERAMIERLHHFIAAIRAYPKPVLAAVEGAAAGTGFSLALACDLIVAAADARFVMAYAKVGLSPDGGATWNLARSLPRALAQQMFWLAEPVSAQTLHGHGLVAAVTPTGNAFDEAVRLAERLTAMAPNALASAKELLEQASGRSLAEQLGAERDHFLDNLFHANGEEGLRAFIDKRAPCFS